VQRTTHGYHPFCIQGGDALLYFPDQGSFITQDVRIRQETRIRVSTAIQLALFDLKISNNFKLMADTSCLGVGLDSSVGTATRYGLDGPVTETRGGGGDFRTRPHLPWGPPNLLHNGYRVSFPGGKRPGGGVHHTTPSSAEVKERVELHLYSPSGSSWPALYS
jgi:hypothetical protein